MSRRQQWKHWQPGGLDPVLHNQIVRNRKQFRRLVARTTELVRAMNRTDWTFRMRIPGGIQVTHNTTPKNRSRHGHK